MSDDMKLLLEKRRIALIEIVRSMDEVFRSFGLDDSQKNVVKLIKQKAITDLTDCDKKLAPLKEAAKQRKNERKAEQRATARKTAERADARKRRIKAARRKADAGLRVIKKKIDDKNEKIHKVEDI